MEPLAILHTDPLDLLFENKNKSYGAYTLRKYYPRRLLISMGIIFSLVVIVSLFYLYNSSASVYIQNRPLLPDVIIQDVYLHQDMKPLIPPVRPSVPRPHSTVVISIPVIVPDQNVRETVPTVDMLQTSAIGFMTTIGEEGKEELPKNGSSTAGLSAQTSAPAEEKAEILATAEVMPEFPGGIEALKSFLLRNLRMPENSLDAGTQVQVIARFVVGIDGRVRDIEITRASDAVFNREVLRVISKMPDWKPGLQNHRPVAVYFSLPVNFVGAE